MRLAIIQNLYPSYIKKFEETNKENFTSYESCLKLLHQDAFAWNGVWGGALAKENIEVVELYVNFEALNRHWCEENGLNFEQLTTENILFEQLKKFKVDAVLNTDVKLLKSTFIKGIKGINGVRAVFAHICSPYFTPLDLAEYNGIFTCLRYFEEQFKHYGFNAFYLPHCFNPAVLSKIGENAPLSKINKVFFAGGIVKGQDLHDDREKLLLKFFDQKIPFAFFSELYAYNRFKNSGIFLGKSVIFRFNNLLRKLKISESDLNKIPVLREGLSWKYLPGGLVDRRLTNNAHAPLYGLDLLREMQKYSISLNIHAGVAQDEAANMRLFEATGVGATLLTDYKSNLSDFFELDKEVIAYRTIDEAIEKAKYLLDNPAIAAQIGKAGQARILKDHTFDNRAPILASHISRVI